WEMEPGPEPLLPFAASDEGRAGDDTATLPAASRRAKPRKTSRARPADRQLTQAMRDALAAWAEDADAGAGEQDNVAAEPDQAPPRRPPQPSTYLNSAGPAPKKRKRKDTRDWLC